jgi:hypothetical protein
MTQALYAHMNNKRKRKKKWVLQGTIDLAFKDQFLFSKTNYLLNLSLAQVNSDSQDRF